MKSWVGLTISQFDKVGLGWKNSPTWHMQTPNLYGNLNIYIYIYIFIFILIVKIEYKIYSKKVKIILSYIMNRPHLSLNF